MFQQKHISTSPLYVILYAKEGDYDTLSGENQHVFSKQDIVYTAWRNISVALGATSEGHSINASASKVVAFSLTCLMHRQLFGS